MAQQTFNNSVAVRNGYEASSTNLNLAHKIKKEQIDPEIESEIKIKENIIVEQPDNDIQGQNGHTKKNDSQEELGNEDINRSGSSSQVSENEEKNVEPVKSSNEILTELFKVFNAAPPEELLDDKNLIKKSKRHKKNKKKHKKQKVDGLVPDNDGVEVLRKKKSKKKHKHRHKDASKEKNKSKNKEKEREQSKDIDKKSSECGMSREREYSKERTISKNITKSRDADKKLMKSLNKLEKASIASAERKRYVKNDDRTGISNKKQKVDEKEIETNSIYTGLRDNREHFRDGKEKLKIKSEHLLGSSRHSEDSHTSEISLSDEETYLQEKEVRTEVSERKSHNSFYDGLKCSRSRDKERERNHGHCKERYRDRDRDRESFCRNREFCRRYCSRYSRSRSRSRSRDLGIDKKRLLEIARKNAISMFKRGNLPNCDNMSQEIKDKVLLKMRYGGRTVEDLTEFCKKISNGENLSDLSSDEASDVDKAGNTKAFHHPFQLKEREPIVMHIRTSKPSLPISTKTEEQTKAITMQFPVSSGQQHRMTEHWVPVETKIDLTPLPALPAAAQSTTIFKSSTFKNALGKSLPLAEIQEPAFKSLPAVSDEFVTEIPTMPPLAVHIPPVALAKMSTSATVVSPVVPLQTMPAPSINVTTTTLIPASAFVPDVMVPSTNSSVFPHTNCSTPDVSSIISKRLNAMRRLQENPMDSEAIKMMYNSQREMSSWASSKHLPGQFTGSTGVNVLKPNELNSGPQVWARRDQLISTKPVTGGMGMHLLQKMGWRPGEGLGRDKNGSLQPLLLEVKMDKRGLVSQDDCNHKGMTLKRRGCNLNVQAAQQNLEGKHPVCLLNELTSKRKWTPPLYTLVDENGPSHSKMFLFSVQVNGQTFTPNKACNTKKEAKLIAARHCLQQIGILPMF